MKTFRALLASLSIAAAVAAAGSAARAAESAPEPRVISIAAHRFAFEPAEIHLKKGETVRLDVTSGDVSHGFFQRALHIDADLAPGKTTPVLVTPGEAGAYTLICDHFCGSGHGGMKMTIVVE